MAMWANDLQGHTLVMKCEKGILLLMKLILISNISNKMLCRLIVHTFVHRKLWKKKSGISSTTVSPSRTSSPEYDPEGHLPT
jgi:hypothetical protein